MRMLMIFSFLAFTFVISFAQDNTSFHFQGEHNYGKSQIYLDNIHNTFYKAKKIQICNDTLSITGQNNLTIDDELTVPLDSVYIIKSSIGTYTKEYAIYGCLLSGLTATASLLNSNDPNNAEIDGTTKRDMILGFTVGGLIVGAIWGACSSKWETIYHKDQTSLDNRVKINYTLSYLPQSNGILFNINLGLL